MNYGEKGIDIIVGTTLPTLDLFQNYKNGSDAFYLFFLYLKQSRIQDTKETFSLDKFMKKATGRSEYKFRNAKNVLKELGIIKQIVKRDEEGKIAGYYVGIVHKYRLSSTGKNQSLDYSSTGQIDVQNAPVVKLINAPVVKEQFEEFRKLYPNKKGKAKAMKLFTSKIKTNEKYKELVNGLQGYIKDHNELIAKGEFAPNYQQGDTFLSKETRKDYLGLVAQTQEQARQQAYEQNNLDIYKEFLKNEHGSGRIEKYGQDYSLLKKEINEKDFISQ